MFGKIPRPKALQFPKTFPQFTDQLAAAASSFAFQLDIIFLKTNLSLRMKTKNNDIFRPETHKLSSTAFIASRQKRN